MFNQLLYYIAALVLYSVQQPGPQPVFSPLETALLGLGVFALFVLICRLAFLRLRLALVMDLPRSVVTFRYHRLQARLSILALLFFSVYIYVLNIKFYISAWPVFADSLTLSGVVSLALYIAHLGVIWAYSHPIYQRIHHSSMGRAAFVKGQLSFSSAILVPWLLISLLSDLLQWVTLPAFFNTDAGQFLILGFGLLLFVLFAPGLVVRLWGCQTLPDSSVRGELEDFCRSQRFRIGDFKLWPLFGGEMLTAGVVGIMPRWRYILITRGLLSLLDIDELKAVVGHEIGHVRKFHLLLYVVFFLGFSVLTFSLNDIFLLFLLRSTTFLGWATASDTLHLTLFSIVYSVPILAALVVYFRYIFGFFMRNSERQADLYALQLIGHPFTLISSLEKIGLYSGHIRDLPSWHHYSIRQRVEFLLDASRDPAVIKRHNRKLYGAALLFLVVVAGLSVGSFDFQGTKTFHNLSAGLQIDMLEHQVKQDPENAELQATYGGLLLEAGRYEEAQQALQSACELAPGDAGILNNLAWLYATAPPPFFKPRAALELARKAAALSPEPPVLDTLAEAYYLNGQYQEAVQTIDRALEQQLGKNRDYYLKQKKKFEDALKHKGSWSGLEGGKAA